MTQCDTEVHTWLCIDDHLLPGMGRWVATAVGHVLAGSKLQHFHEAQRHAPLEKELLVERDVAAAIRTPGQSPKRHVTPHLHFRPFLKGTVQQKL